ncbi:hypothetical protein DFH29DRAFT_870697 [Suillus ampliporus]|nr:hypothetical protein DFH29DRAFT_870697 [Suillus ampliporus]
MTVSKLAGIFQLCSFPESAKNLCHNNCNIIYQILKYMASEVFNSNGLMGTMPKRVITQADYFWGQGNAAATPTTTTGPEPQIRTTLAQGLLNAATETTTVEVPHPCHEDEYEWVLGLPVQHSF